MTIVRSQSTWQKSSHSGTQENCVEVAFVRVWRKSSYSTSQENCVEVGYTWRKSSRSGSQENCVEVAPNVHGYVAVRDSKNPEGPALSFSPGVFGAFVAAMRRDRVR
ncbi:DUF397 domain-containing protein [Streptoalloteichus hindustanus]|uniref:DUF397 domain-containing protein n=1 Tax=Streptoalloteichus hindustanus TaxID=2017 RepID=UPI001F1B66DC|nr:DUF397 domain-containing protein [Streptoalloteichus hindustanus]